MLCTSLLARLDYWNEYRVSPPPPSVHVNPIGDLHRNTICCSNWNPYARCHWIHANVSWSHTQNTQKRRNKTKTCTRIFCGREDDEKHLLACFGLPTPINGCNLFVSFSRESNLSNSNCFKISFRFLCKWKECNNLFESSLLSGGCSFCEGRNGWIDAMMDWMRGVNLPTIRPQCFAFTQNGVALTHSGSGNDNNRLWTWPSFQQFQNSWGTETFPFKSKAFYVFSLGPSSPFSSLAFSPCVCVCVHAD